MGPQGKYCKPSDQGKQVDKLNPYSTKKCKPPG